MIGGAEQHLRNIAINYAKRDYNIYVLITRNIFTNQWNNLGENIFPIPPNSHVDKYDLAHVLKQIYYLSRSANLTFTFSSHTYINGMLGILRRVSLLRTKHLVFRESTTLFTRYHGFKILTYRVLYWIGYGASDLVICQTQRMKTQLIQNIKKASNWHVKVIPNPIELQLVKHMAKEDSLVNIRGDYIVAAGRLIPVKGFDILMESYSALRQEFPNLSLVILGEGPERDSYKRLIKSLNIENSVHLIGHVSNPIPFFKGAKACVVSSLVEGFPNVLLQMMAVNDIIVSTTCAGGIDNIMGLFTCDPNSVHQLTSTIIKALDSASSINTQAQFNEFLSKNSLDNYIQRLERYVDEQ